MALATSPRDPKGDIARWRRRWHVSLPKVSPAICHQRQVYAPFTRLLQWRTMVLLPPLPAEEGAWGLQEIQPWRGRALGPHMLFG